MAYQSITTNVLNATGPGGTISFSLSGRPIEAYLAQGACLIDSTGRISEQSLSAMNVALVNSTAIVTMARDGFCNPGTATLKLRYSPRGDTLYSTPGGGTAVDASLVYTPVNAEITALQALWKPSQFPSYQAQTAYDTLISALKNGATSGTNMLTSRFDGLYVLCGFDSASSMKNLKTIVSSPGTFDLTNNNTAFSIARGFTGDGVGSNLDTGFDLFADAAKLYQQNSNHMAAQISTVSPNNGTLAATFGNKPASGVVSSGVWINNGSGGSAWKNMTSGFVQPSGAASPYNNAYMLTRAASNSITFYRNLTTGGANGTASAAPSAASTLRFLGDSNASFSSNAQMTWGTFGSALSLTEWTDTYNAFQAFLTTLGAL